MNMQVNMGPWGQREEGGIKKSYLYPTKRKDLDVILILEWAQTAGQEIIHQHYD